MAATLKKPKPPALRDAGKEYSDLFSQWGSQFPGRNDTLLGATTGNFDSLLASLRSGVAGERGGNINFLKNRTPLLKANREVQQATREATAPTALQGQLDTEGARALSDPLGGNIVLGHLTSSMGPSDLLKTLTTQAHDELGRNGALSPEEEMQARQGARAAYAAQGFSLGSPTATAEILNRSNFVKARQDRARTFATSTEQLGQGSRGQDIALGGLAQDAINSGRTFALGVNAGDLDKQKFDLGAKASAAQWRLSTSPGMIAYQTASMAPQALQLGMTSTQMADVLPQMMNYSEDLNNTNFNALESRYRGDVNRYYAQQAMMNQPSLSWWQRMFKGASTGAQEGGQFGGAWGAAGGAVGGAVDGAADGPIYQMHYPND